MNGDAKNNLPLVLGTAQLGMNYGIANKNGKPGLDQSIEIVKAAWENGIRFFDTAQAYGDSEKVLGKCFKELKGLCGYEQPAVISKLNPDISPSDTNKIFREVDESLKKLGLNFLWGLMLHRESLLEQGREHLGQIGPKLKSENKIKNFGMSIYSPVKAIEALNMDEIDIMQVPFNVFDQGALEYGVFRLAKEKNKKVFIRSVYLQGLLLLNPNQLPENMGFSKEALKKYIDFAKRYEICPKLLALAFVIQKASDEMIVIGAEKPEQVQENIFLLKQAREVSLPDLSSFSENEPRLINPSLW